MKTFAVYLLATTVNTLLAGIACISLVIVLEPISMILAFASMIAAASVFGYVQIYLGAGNFFSQSDIEEEV